MKILITFIIVYIPRDFKLNHEKQSFKFNTYECFKMDKY